MFEKCQRILNQIMDNFNFYIFLKSVVNSDSREQREMEKHAF